MSFQNQRHKLVFVGGLHRSGTSVLFRCLREHPSISGFRDTGVREDEGQHLQSVFPSAKHYGGSGRFGFAKEAHLTETSPLVNKENRIRLWTDWARYWDLNKPCLLEKSPPNLIRTRFLQALFPNAYFVILLRHPVAVSFATQKRSHISLIWLLKHWVHCHSLFALDRRHLRQALVIKYESFVNNPEVTLRQIYAFLGVEDYSVTEIVHPNVNQQYFRMWECRYRNRLLSRLYRQALTVRFEKQVNRFGYSLRDVWTVI